MWPDCGVWVQYPGGLEQRKTLWSTLNDLTCNIHLPWIINGDFNAMLHPQDRLFGAPVTPAEIKDFAKCGSDRVCCRLDKALGNDLWMMKWGHIYVEYDCPLFSDHSPLLITIKIPIWKPKIPFRFFNVWAEHAEFVDLVTESWTENTSVDNMKNIWMELKKLRVGLKNLNKKEFMGIRHTIEKTRSDLQVLQEINAVQYSDQRMDQEREMLVQLEKWSLIEESGMRQKSRIHWMKLGDHNTQYFSSVVKERGHKKQIYELQSLCRQKITHPTEIKTEIINFDKGLMGSSAHKLPAIDRTIMRCGPQLTHEQQLALCDEKSWPIIKHDIVQAVQDFFSTGKLYRAINCTVVTLVPKLECPSTVKDFRPIACCTVMYKIIAKILAAMLQKVIGSIICNAQAGFIPGRQLADNVILAHELVKGYARKHITPRSMIKIDLKKAYDSVEWLRQGDPMSPFLFAISMEYLSRELNTLTKSPNFAHHPRCAKLGITHLSFADDLLLSAKGDLPSVTAIQQVFNRFFASSGLQANLDKSSVYFGGVSLAVKDQSLSQLEFTQDEMPFRYLGVPLSTKKMSLLQWHPLVDKMVARISSWTAKHLSYAGRMQLVQTVLFDIQAFWL
ncbi:hypothetical protein MTR67_024222 [Solanum verrucosum]|uniref:Reverse transcriptase domain-containing protein n=1 Tax=Solanum verrucosum TaxID=315347 RepID=A0AAF0QUY9_SOLVR|nr:hypothetical protein MTR67_024222 [Solanum verrucosum]